jgi:hypothetical protein
LGISRRSPGGFALATPREKHDIAITKKDPSESTVDFTPG